MALFIFGVCPQAGATGFGLYEASAGTYARGGAVLGRAVDASANFHNPATLTDLTNATLSIGFMTEHPRGRMKVSRGGETVGGRYYHMDPGVFILPSFQLAVPLPWDFSFGLGVMPEYGLGSAYDDNWPLANNSTETTVTSFTINPNLAYKVTDRWSIAGGFRFLYFDFEQYSRPWVQNRLLGQLNNRLKGDNNLRDWGWQVGTKYDLFDNFSLGAVYKSRTLVHVKGKTSTSVRHDGGTHALGYPITDAQATASALDGSAETELMLPQSITAGFNWDIADDWHLGGMIGWTEWSTVDVLDFNLNGTHKDVKLNWCDTWRMGLAPSWDFAEDWTLSASYIFETDCTDRQESTMLPGSRRHMVSLGLDWLATENWGFSLTYGMILMDGITSHARGENDELLRYQAHRALSHAAGFTLTYRF